MDLTLLRPSDGDAMTRPLFAGRPPCWDGRLDGSRNVLTGRSRPIAALVAFMAGGPTEPAPATCVIAVCEPHDSMDCPECDAPAIDVDEREETAVEDETAAALRAFGVETVDQLPEFARRQLAGIPCSWRPLRGYGRRGLVALLDIAWPARMRRARAANAPHRRRVRWALRGGYALAAAAVPVVAMLLGRGL